MRTKALALAATMAVVLLSLTSCAAEIVGHAIAGAIVNTYAESHAYLYVNNLAVKGELKVFVDGNLVATLPPNTARQLKDPTNIGAFSPGQHRIRLEHPNDDWEGVVTFHAGKAYTYQYDGREFLNLGENEGPRVE